MVFALFLLTGGLGAKAVEITTQYSPRHGLFPFPSVIVLSDEIVDCVLGPAHSDGQRFEENFESFDRDIQYLVVRHLAERRQGTLTSIFTWLRSFPEGKGPLHIDRELREMVGHALRDPQLSYERKLSLVESPIFFAKSHYARTLGYSLTVEERRRMARKWAKEGKELTRSEYFEFYTTLHPIPTEAFIAGKQNVIHARIALSGGYADWWRSPELRPYISSYLAYHARKSWGERMSDPEKCRLWLTTLAYSLRSWHFENPKEALTFARKELPKILNQFDVVLELDYLFFGTWRNSVVAYSDRDLEDPIVQELLLAFLHYAEISGYKAGELYRKLGERVTSSRKAADFLERYRSELKWMMSPSPAPRLLQRRGCGWLIATAMQILNRWPSPFSGEAAERE